MGVFMVTLKDVAEKAGVAYSTASIALRGVGSVKGATRERVLRAVEALGYQANPAAAALAGQRKRARGAARKFGVAVVVDPLAGADRAVAGVCAEADRLGYGVERVAVETLAEGGLRRLWHRGVEGLVLFPGWDWTRHDWGRTELSRFALVKVGRVLPELPVPLVRSSVVNLVKEGLDHVFARGNRRVLCWSIRTPSVLDDDIRLGTFYAYRENHLRKGCTLEWRILEGRNSAEYAAKALVWIEALKPDAVFSFPWHLCRGLRDAGIRIPADLDFIGFPLVDPDAAAQLGIPGMDPLRREQGRVAMLRLHEQILAGQRGIPESFTETVVEPVWREGAGRAR